MGQDTFGETLKCFRILSADKAQEGVFGWQKAASHKVIFVAYISQRTLNIATTMWLTDRYPWKLQKNRECLGVVRPTKRKGSAGGTKESLLTDAQVRAIRVLLKDKISNNTSMRSLKCRLESFPKHNLRVFSNYSHKHFAVAGFYAATYLGRFPVKYFHCDGSVANWNPRKINERNM